MSRNMVVLGIELIVINIVFVKIYFLFIFSKNLTYYNFLKLFFQMGNDCLASTPIEHYSTWFFKGGSYFENLEVSELKDHWTTYKTYKIKKIYDKAST